MTDGVNPLLSGIDMSIQAICIHYKTNVGVMVRRFDLLAMRP